MACVVAYMKYYNKENTDKNICQGVQLKMPDSGYTFSGQRMMKHW